ncbi:hypothetical protein EP7_004426 [Isosphaeraceae bacterium EP7]
MTKGSQGRPMGFKQTRRALIEALLARRIEFEDRRDAGSKNLLYTGEVTPEFVVELLLRCTGDQHSTSRHHMDRDQIVDIFKVPNDGVRWYIKSYLVEDDGVLAIFISVHP